MDADDEDAEDDGELEEVERALAETLIAKAVRPPPRQSTRCDRSTHVTVYPLAPSTPATRYPPQQLHAWHFPRLEFSAPPSLLNKIRDKRRPRSVIRYGPL